MRKKRIYVTKDDIAKGCRFNSRNCPIARAMKRAFGRLVGVDGLMWYLYRSVKRGITGPNRRLPASAQRFITAFDKGRAVNPFRFTVTY